MEKECNFQVESKYDPKIVFCGLANIRGLARGKEYIFLECNTDLCPLYQIWKPLKEKSD